MTRVRLNDPIQIPNNKEVSTLNTILDDGRGYLDYSDNFHGRGGKVVTKYFVRWHENENYVWEISKRAYDSASERLQKAEDEAISRIIEHDVRAMLIHSAGDAELFAGWMIRFEQQYPQGLQSVTFNRPKRDWKEAETEFYACIERAKAEHEPTKDYPASFVNCALGRVQEYVFLDDMGILIEKTSQFMLIPCYSNEQHVKVFMEHKDVSTIIGMKDGNDAKWKTIILKYEDKS